MENNPVCFGKFPKGETPCAKCEFFDSCRYFAATARQEARRERFCSFDAVSYRLADLPASGTPSGNEDHSLRGKLITMLGKFFRYLLELDDYTVGLISQIILSYDPAEPCSVSSLSRLHNCSRQAMHRKILAVIARNPELSTLFQSIMGKLSAGRRTFLRHRAAEVPGLD